MEEVAFMEKQIPDFVPPLVGTMKVHQTFSESRRKPMYRDLSCYCSRGICSCLKPKEYVPVNDEYSSDSDSSDADDTKPLSAFKDISNNNNLNLPSTSKQSDELL